MRRTLFSVLVLIAVAGIAGAHNWTLQEEFIGDITFGIDFLDTETGWIAGGSNLMGGPIIYKTENGGDNWTIQTYEMLTMMYLDIDMADDQTGYAGGLAMFGFIGPGSYTTNGGNSWLPLNLGYGIAQAWQDVYTLDADHCWMTGFWAGLFGEGYGVAVTTNQGDSWDKIDWGIDDSPRYSWFINENEGWCAGGHWPEEEAAGYLHRFENDPSPVRLPGGFPEPHAGMDFTDYHGVIARTTDGGENWTLLYENNDFYFNEIQFLDRYEGWCVGEAWPNDVPNAVILHTIDGGNTWEEAFFTDQHGLTGIDFVDRNHGFATGMGSGAFNPQPRILRTSDGGENWTLDAISVGYGTMYGSFPTIYEGWSIGSNNFNNSGLFHYYDPSSVPQVEVTVSGYPGSAQPGDTVQWFVNIHNLSGDPVTFDVWLSVTSEALPPQHNPYVMVLAEDITVPGGFNDGATVNVSIPSIAPLGDYNFETIAGVSPDTAYDSDDFDLIIN